VTINPLAARFAFCSGFLGWMVTEYGAGGVAFGGVVRLLRGPTGAEFLLPSRPP